MPESDIINKLLTRNEEKKKRNASYYQTHKETMGAKIQCPCGGRYTLFNKSNHCSSMKHINWLKNNACPTPHPPM